MKNPTILFLLSAGFSFLYLIMPYTISHNLLSIGIAAWQVKILDFALGFVYNIFFGLFILKLIKVPNKAKVKKIKNIGRIT